MTLGSVCRIFTPTIAVCFLFASAVFGQADIERKTIAVTYPLEETVTVKFRGTTILPRLKGEAKVKRAGRRGTRVELNIDDLPRASELGGIYTTYILWAISPDGHVDNLGEIKRSGSSFVDSKLDVTTPLQSFAMILTAEPHFLVKVPSRMVVMENLPPQRAGGAHVAGDGPRERGVSAPGRYPECGLDGSGALFRSMRPGHATDSGRRREVTCGDQTGRAR